MPDAHHAVRILLMADSHLGFDLPVRPRVERRRRGHDFLANHERALAAAKAEGADLVVHGGDLFHRSRVPSSLVFQAFRPLLELADAGIPVFLVPGNHERSRIPHRRFGTHSNLHIFHEPATVVVEVRGMQVALSGFPYQRKNIRETFPHVLEETGWRQVPVDIRALCMHHCVEGATVGPNDYTFRHAADVIRCSNLPPDFAAVLSGHIHRPQVLEQDLQGRPLSTPVFYPGSVERTAYAEMGERKRFMVLDIEPNGFGGRVVGHRFEELHARPMLVRELRPRKVGATGWCPTDLRDALTRTLADVPADAVLRIRVHGPVDSELRAVVAASRLRRMAPAEMNLEVIFVEDRGKGTLRANRTGSAAAALENPANDPQVSLLL